jgi:hypothetical protein
MGVVLVATARAGDIPFIKILEAPAKARFNDLGEVIYTPGLDELVSTGRPEPISNDVDGSNFGISNSGEVVYSTRSTQEVISTTRGVLTPPGSFAPMTSSTTGEVVYMRADPTPNIFSTVRGQLTFFPPDAEKASLPDVNDLGEVVFELRTLSSPFTRIFSTTRGFLTPPDTDARQPAINNLGEVVYSGRDSEGRQQIISTVRGPLTSFGGSVSVLTAHEPDIDNFGNVIFVALIGGTEPENDGVWLLPVKSAVALDIKPQGCPNPLNTKSNGVTPVAILGTADVDLAQIDIASVRLEEVAAIRSAIEDVATPFTPTNGLDDALACTDVGPDGFDDLTLKFDNQELIAALGEVEDGEVRILTLTGVLLDGTPIEGQDVVVIKAKGGGNN